MTWGTDGGKCRVDILEPLGLYSYGGGSIDGRMTYTIYSYKDKNFKIEIYVNEIDEISKNKEVQNFLRKKKLERICNA